jgi:hypothetical protein
MYGFKKMLTLDTSQKIMKDYISTQMCEQLIKNKKMCDGIVKQIGNYILNCVTDSLLLPEYFCEELAPACGDSEFEFFSATPYVDRILFTKIPSAQSNDALNLIYKKISDEVKATKKPRKTIRAVHFTDAHVDNAYKTGSDNSCGDFLCCHLENGYPNQANRRA